MMGYGDFGWMGGFGWLWMVITMAVIIGVLIWGAGPMFGFRGNTGEATAQEILRRRFAAGEITETEFEQAKHTLA